MIEQLPCRSLSCQRIDFIEEDDARTAGSSPLEYVPDRSFGLSHVFGEQLRAFDADEVEFRFSCYRLSHHGLAAAGRTVKHDTFAGLDAELDEFVSMLEWKLDNFLYFLLDRLVASDLVPVHLRNFNNQLFDLSWPIFLEHIFEFVLSEFLAEVAIGLSENLLDFSNAEPIQPQVDLLETFQTHGMLKIESIDESMHNL